MINQFEIQLPPFARGFHLITQYVEREMGSLPDQGVLQLFIKHTSAGLTINENSDPSVLKDFESYFNHIVQERTPFTTHTMEGPDDMPSHIKSSLVGASLQLPIQNHKLALGTWQGTYLCEFRNRPRSRHLIATVLS